jgi:hypothetical protein
MRKFLLIPLCLVFAQVAIAQDSDKIAVEQVIRTLFEGMKEKDREKVQTAFHEHAIMHTVQEAQVNSQLGGSSVEDFINRIATTPAGTVLDERILSYEIKVDGDMASAWTPYEFYVNDDFSHCGTNSFQLIKTDGEWKITYVIDTRRKVDCG